ncbi:helix-turn-helix transcriptional regulator [Haloarchaeobius amylolyticus]|uniref:helix-turn-helix transcriptional regulator n=1 Tax=Haloarchaeobius amylolyticus TaxID=1198296 RepID=UPI0022715601|nr:transcriptional regulator FilR1 domain-containing protein [Haloarchaeobius amylolyticus]
MVGPTQRLGFVSNSAARRAVLHTLAEDARPRQAVVDAVSASESAVYDALNRLQRRGYVYERDDGDWALTGTGWAVHDLLDQIQAVEGVMDDAAEYWQTHDLSVLPECGRRTLNRLEGCSVVRSPDADPFRAARCVQDAIEGSASVDVIAPVYDDRFADALVDCDDPSPRLLVTPQLLEGAVETDGPAEEETAHLDVRVTTAGFAMAVTEDQVCVSLPKLEGGYDAKTELVARSPESVEWGASVFERVWDEATPVEAFVADE